MIKSVFLSCCVVLLLLTAFSGEAYAQVNWTGAVSTDWANGSNWSSGVVPGPTDNVQIGSIKFTAQPAISGNVQIHNLTFGAAFQVVLTIPGGYTLIVSNKIVQDHAADNQLAVTLVTGAGALTCNSVMVGDLTSPRFVQTKTTTFAAKLANFNITGNIDLNSVTANLLTGGVANNNSLFSLQGGVLNLGGKINTNTSLPESCNSFGGNSPNDKFSIDINSDQDAVLKLTDSSAVNILNPDYATVDFFNHLSGNGRSKVEYTGANQIVYTNTIAGIDSSPYNYQDLTISGAGIKTAGSDSTGNQLNIAGNLVINSATLDLKAFAPQTLVNGDFRNLGTVNFGTATTTINGASFFNSGSFNAGSGVIQFSGVTQSLVDSTLNGTDFRRVGFNNSGVKNIQSGKFAVVPKGKVRLSNMAKLTVVPGAMLIVRADSTGAAAVAALPSGCSVTGQVSVEQFIQGSLYLKNTVARGYLRFSSPVNFTGTTSGDRAYNITYLIGTNDYNGIATGGPDDGGFSIATNPTLYLYREDIGACGGSYTCGNYIGLTKINYPDQNIVGTRSRFSSSTIPDTTLTLPIGTGLMVYFLGNKVLSNGSTTGTKGAPPLNYPESVTLTNTGTINQNNVQFRDWFRSDYHLSYTNSPLINNTGYNANSLFGNPYPAPVNWDNFSSTDSTSSIYAPNMTRSFYIYNTITHQSNAYVADSTHDKTLIYNGTGQATNVLASSQGFIVKVDALSANPYAASLRFKEAAKFDPDAVSWPGMPVGNQSFAIAQKQVNRPVSASLNKSLSSNIKTHASPNKKAPVADQFFRLKLIQDTVNYDDILIRFGEGATDRYDPREDAYDLGGSEEATTMLSSYSSDHIPLSINKIPPPALSKAILLFTDAKESGRYSLLAGALENMPANYRIMLKDKLAKKIVDLRVLSRYEFVIDKNKKASFGDRFELIISKRFQGVAANSIARLN